MKYYYYCNCWDFNAEDINIDDCYDIEHDKCEDEWEYEWLVEKCAEDYHSNHDGWEHRSWPNGTLPFFLFDSEMNLIGVYNVALEFEPSFAAWKQK